MSYLSLNELRSMGFKYIGANVKVSAKASIYDAEKISLENNARIDDFCILSGKIVIGKNVHVTPYCLLAGASVGIMIDDFVTLAYGVKIFTRTDDYSGEYMTNSTLPNFCTNSLESRVHLRKHTILGTNTIVMPGVVLGEGTATGASTFINSDTQDWSVYAGIPATKIKDRSRNLLQIEKDYLSA